MKKLISVIMSVLMIAALSVNAIALTAIDLKPGQPTVAEPIILEDSIDFTEGSENVLFTQNAGGGKFYVPIYYGGAELTNIELVVDGVKARIVDFDPETMVYPGYEPTYCLYCARQPIDDPEVKGLSYSEAKELAKELAKQNKKTYQVMPETFVYVAEFTLAPNYSASFEKATFQIKATEKATKTKLATPKITIISDIIFFDYENVKSCGQYGYALKLGDMGYSDYYSWKDGYASAGEMGATCVSKTAFRAIEGKTLVIDLNNNDSLEMKVTGSQTSANFENYFNVNAKKKTIKFGFYGNPMIAGEYTYEVNLGMDAYELAQFYGLSFSEKDVYTFYIMRNGKQIGSFTYDYAKHQSYDDIVIKLTGKGEALGDYEITMTGVQIAEDKSESVSKPTAGSEVNPNTGAEVIFSRKVMAFGIFFCVK